MIKGSFSPHCGTTQEKEPSKFEVPWCLSKSSKLCCSQIKENFHHVFRVTLRKGGWIVLVGWEFLLRKKKNLFFLVVESYKLTYSWWAETWFFYWGWKLVQQIVCFLTIWSFFFFFFSNGNSAILQLQHSR